MGAPLDLTGRRFGRLLVIARDGKIQFGRQMTAWRCQCDCGAQVRVPQDRLPHRLSIPMSWVVESCPACRAIPCVVCGTPVQSKSGRNTCSEECRLQHRRTFQLDYYHRTKSVLPDIAERRAEKARERKKIRWQTDAAFRAEHNKARRERDRLLRRDPARIAELRQRARSRYALNAEQIQERRREQRNALSPKELQGRIDRARAATRRFWSKWRADMALNPERLQEAREMQAEYRRRHRLAVLFAESANLVKASEDRSETRKEKHDE